MYRERMRNSKATAISSKGTEVPVGSMKSNRAVINIKEINIRTLHRQSKRGHSYAVLGIVRKHLAAMEQELSHSVKGILFVGKSNASIDILI